MARFDAVPIKNFSRASATAFRGAAPDERGIEFIYGLGIKTIIDLRAPGSSSRHECLWATGYDLHYFNIPTSYFAISDTVIAAFLALYLHPRYQPVFIHCIGGDDRTGAMIAVSRLAVDGWPFEWAYDEMLKKHFRPWQVFLKRDVHNFADRMTRLNLQQRLSVVQELVEQNLFCA